MMNTWIPMHLLGLDDKLPMLLLRMGLAIWNARGRDDGEFMMMIRYCSDSDEDESFWFGWLTIRV